MIKHIIYIFSGLLLALSLGSCLGMDKEIKDWWERDEDGKLYGTYHFLDDRGIKLYLPEEFKKTSIAEYQIVLDTLLDKKAYNIEIDRINGMQEMEGGFHLFFDKYSLSTCTVNSVDFMPMSKEEAQQFVGIIRASNERSFNNKEFTIEKLSAKYNGNTKEHVFKCVFMISNEKLNNEFYNTTYVVTSNDKTVLIQITSPYKGNFDPFITNINM